MFFETIQIGFLGVNCYVFGDKNEAIVVDPGGEAERICRFIADHDLRVKYIVLTHCHFDHILAANAVKEFCGAEIVACEKEEHNLKNVDVNMTSRFTRVPLETEADIYVSQGDGIMSGEYRFKIIETPGHTSGGMCLYCQEKNILISGDTLFRDSVGRSDFPTGDHNVLIQSIKTKLFSLPDETRVFPGHGEETTVEREKMHNPFII